MDWNWDLATSLERDLLDRSMPFEGRQRAAVLNRCWSIYLALTRALKRP